LTTLALLQRSDNALTRVAATDDAPALATRLGAMQPFSVRVFAEFPQKAALLPRVQEALQAQRCANGWYNAAVEAIALIVCEACVPTASDQVNAPSSDSPSEDDVAPAVAQEEWHTLLKPCNRDEADKATTIRRGLKKALGRWQAESVLSSYKETCLRIGGVCARYVVNDKGETLRLAARTVLN
jgi:hypothetical protein